MFLDSNFEKVIYFFIFPAEHEWLLVIYDRHFSLTFQAKTEHGRTIVLL
jgi:hypothetical protein